MLAFLKTAWYAVKGYGLKPDLYAELVLG